MLKDGLAGMTPKLTPLRKAAILLDSLDDATVDALLRQMAPAESNRVRREVAALGEVDPEIQRQVVAEFRSGASPRDPYPNGIELDDSLVQKISAAAPSLGAPSAGDSEADTLVQFLKHERPQVIALVLSHLAPDRAAKVLDRFEANVQGHVLHCLSHLDETDPAVLHDLEDHLHLQLREHIRLRKCQAAGAAAVSAILAKVDSRKRSIVLQNLADRDRDLANRLQSQSRGSHSSGTYESIEVTEAPDGLPIEFTGFDRLYHLTNEELRKVMSRAKSEVVVIALAGADAPLVERVLKCLPPKQSRLLARALKHLGPTRLGDVEEAQLALARLADDVAGRRTNQPATRNRRALAA
jgi:flagellar motor switch protein FliG